MKAETERKRSFMDRVRRRAVLTTLPYPGRFRLAATTGKLARRMKALVPKQFHAMLDLIPPDLPASRPLPALTPAAGQRRARVALLAGCAQQVLEPEIGWAAIRMLSRAGAEVVVPASQGCCGALAMHVGEERIAKELARVNLGAFPDDVDAVITTAAGCGSGMKENGITISERIWRMNSWIFGGQFDSFEASPCTRARSARSLYPQMWTISLSGPTSVCRNAVSSEYFLRYW